MINLVGFSSTTMMVQEKYIIFVESSRFTTQCFQPNNASSHVLGSRGWIMGGRNRHNFGTSNLVESSTDNSPFHFCFVPLHYI
mmetsp:Transcript_54129/g.131362  ORF Transcript_54129/g.131362 Transcript_54129/m.131362 type:complete len:83 (-) Transcript_54129:885-1133(-)